MANRAGIAGVVAMLRKNDAQLVCAALVQDDQPSCFVKRHVVEYPARILLHLRVCSVVDKHAGYRFYAARLRQRSPVRWLHRQAHQHQAPARLHVLLFVQCKFFFFFNKKKKKKKKKKK